MATSTGCTSCGSADTVTIDGINGRRCADCLPGFDPGKAVELADRGLPGSAGTYLRATLPAGAYRPDLAEDMVASGRADAAFLYLGTYLARELDQRFAGAQQALGKAATT